MTIGRDPEPTPDDEIAGDTLHVRNSFWSTRLRTTIIVGEERRAGLFHKLVVNAVPRQRMKRIIQTVSASIAWDLAAETMALATLARLVTDFQFKCYLLTGCLVETSPRSGARYMFRRLRPTLAFAASDESWPVAALCMHPIAYYEGTFAGAMVPTDDLIAHLVLMRGDERLFWARCNQHSPHKEEAGI